MTSAQILSQTLNLLGGELRDSAGEMVTAADRVVVAVQDVEQAREALAEGRRAAIVVSLAHPGRLRRVAALCLVRTRISDAKRRLAAAGAHRIRALVIMSAADSLFLVYELGQDIQPYIEERVVLQPAASAISGAGRRLFRRLIGLAPTADLVMVVGEPA